MEERVRSFESGIEKISLDILRRTTGELRVQTYMPNIINGLMVCGTNEIYDQNSKGRTERREAFTGWLKLFILLIPNKLNIK